ncbi:MAG: hypothetical protein KJS97_01640 [Alphaproteobacteria bacterium]|nr:hypothetical protein [Alphaproteobacteria bacterium]
MTQKENGPGALAGATEAGNESAHGLAHRQYSEPGVTAHRVGERIRQTARGVVHVYTLARVEPHTNASGESSALLTWEGRCVRCGDRFEHVTGRRAPRYLNRTCRPCRSAPDDAERVDALAAERLAAMVDVSPYDVLRDEGGAE